ncbi:cytochrome c biogenesis CcdA family protein [Halobacteriota archaeon]
MDLTIISVLLAGFIISIEPCAITVDLLIIGYILGAEHAENARSGFLKGFSAGLAFIFGRSLTYALMGGLVSFVGSSSIRVYAGTAANAIIGPILILVGLVMLDVIHLDIGGNTKILEARSKLASYGIFGTLLLGILFGVAIYPCSTPVLIALLSMVAVKANIAQGMFLMFLYGLALGAPLPFIASGVVSMKTYAEKTKRAGLLFKKLAGFILIAFGFYYLLPYFSGML